MADEQASSSLKWELLVADTWEDAELKQRLLSDPAAVFKERGITTSPDCEVKIVEDTDDVMHLVLPTAPGEAELSEEELESVAGGHVTLCIRLSGGCGGGGRCGRGCGGGCGGGGHSHSCHHSHHSHFCH